LAEYQEVIYLSEITCLLRWQKPHQLGSFKTTLDRAVMNVHPQGRNVELSMGPATPGIFLRQDSVTLWQGATKGRAFPNSLCSDIIIIYLEAFPRAINNRVAK